VNEGRRAMLKLKHQILDNILLRRTKTTRADDIQLPMRIVQVRQERLDEKEEDFYQALYTQSQAQFNTYLMAGTVLNNYAHIFDILIKLRQAVDHPYLVIYSNSQGNNSAITAAAAAADEASRSRRAALTQSAEEDDRAPCCGLCQDPIEDPVKTVCDHWFCRACIMDYLGTVSSAALANSSGLCCPDCNQPLTLFLADNNNADDQLSSNFTNSIWNESKRRRKGILDKIDLRNFQSSTKTEALMEELYRMEEEDVGSKAIVFSQFVNMLDILEYRIQIGGIGCVKLSGSMTVEQRDKTITAFKEDSTIRVLLISLKAGGVALNLTVASRIFLMDPWWNPAAEMQAIDRTHRIGQYKPIFATRFIIEDSIEERILKLQEKKKLVFDGTVGGDTGSMTKLTVDDMRFLFQ
jgi:DNA repair protein RAD16